MDVVKVSRKHQIAVPARARRQLDIHAGNLLSVAVEDGRIVLSPQRDDALERLLKTAPDVWRTSAAGDAANAVDLMRDEWTSRER